MDPINAPSTEEYRDDFVFAQDNNSKELSWLSNISITTSIIVIFISMIIAMPSLRLRLKTMLTPLKAIYIIFNSLGSDGDGGSGNGFTKVIEFLYSLLGSTCDLVLTWHEWVTILFRDIGFRGKVTVAPTKAQRQGKIPQLSKDLHSPDDKKVRSQQSNTNAEKDLPKLKETVSFSVNIAPAFVKKSDYPDGWMSYDPIQGKLVSNALRTGTD
eukprot:142931_1